MTKKPALHNMLANGLWNKQTLHFDCIENLRCLRSSEGRSGSHFTVGGGVENRLGWDFSGRKEGKKNGVIYIYCRDKGST